MACRVAALFNSRRETDPPTPVGTDVGTEVGAESGDDDGGVETEPEVDTQLHYVQVCTLGNRVW